MPCKAETRYKTSFTWTKKIAFKDKVKKAFKQMEKLGILIKVDKLSEWGSYVVATEKKNSKQLHIYVDVRGLHKVLMREHQKCPVRCQEIRTSVNSIHKLDTAN